MWQFFNSSCRKLIGLLILLIEEPDVVLKQKELKKIVLSCRYFRPLPFLVSALSSATFFRKFGGKKFDIYTCWEEKHGRHRLHEGDFQGEGTSNWAGSDDTDISMTGLFLGLPQIGDLFEKRNIHAVELL